MQHKGEIIEKAVRESGYSITRLAKKMGKSRRWVYQIFENPKVATDYILEIGKIIHYDFSDEIRELSDYKRLLKNSYRSETDEINQSEYWKNKYLTLLEKYNDLLTELKEK